MDGINATQMKLSGEELWLLPEKAIWWPAKSILIISDLHLGKAMHFRKAGIPVPVNLHQGDLETLSMLITKYRPAKIIFTGDLFHSEINSEWQQFFNWRMQYPDVEFILVEGNHDILSAEVYLNAGISLVKGKLVIEPFVFSHEFTGDESDLYYITGHIHPAFRLTGKGQQSLKLPCYYFGRRYAILPSMGRFTGGVSVEKDAGSRIFVITDSEVLEV